MESNYLLRFVGSVGYNCFLKRNMSNSYIFTEIIRCDIFCFDNVFRRIAPKAKYGNNHCI